MAKLNLVELDAPLDSVILPGGREVRCLFPDAEAYEMLVEHGKAGEDIKTRTGLAYAIAARILPDLTADEVKALSFKSVTLIIAHSTGTLGKVLEAMGEAQGPPTAETGRSLSSPETPSATSVSVSPPRPVSPSQGSGVSPIT